ncbi:hypothetical protein HPB50_005221 [Hyalomma asiaticum]|uniref:Uncharacterized protein n=1 Tax=Hyalomma asiaticum TaxID=266040 RepID=A0ACB7SN36_HYAAI|nr:hypothetical protein HPB50_005221 [Hyalomma asiaticum]
MVAMRSSKGSSSSRCWLAVLRATTARISVTTIDLISSDDLSLLTVQQELRHRHAPGYNAIREILGNKDRHFFVFTNEHHKDTYVEREADESANDRNDRAIRTSVSWYCEHLANKVDVVLLTNDEANRSKAQAQGLKACTFAEYVRSLKDHPGLLDKLAKLELDEAAKNADRRCIYPEHLPQAELHLGIKSGRFEQGKFQASRDNYLEGNVVLGDDEESRSILIQGRSNLNRAVHEDLVVVEIFPEEKWSLPSGLVLVDETQDEEDKAEEEESVKLNPSPAKSNRVPSGRIVGILRRKWRPYCGILAPSTIKEATRHLFVPAERRIPKIRIETRQAETLCRQRIVVSIDSWPRDSRYPLGHLVRALGEIGDRATENQVLLLEHDIPHQCFSRAVLDCLPSMPWTIGPKEEEGRKDLRHLCICSVDPPGCTDIDDALHCRELPTGNYEVGVHIADVSHFVRPGTALDKEAANRGTTVYLVDQGFELKVDSGLHLAQSLDRAVLPDCPYFNVMLRMVATRCMARALYFSSGCVALEDFFTMALPCLTTLTSHRLFGGAELCNNLNYRHNMAQYAGRASVALYTQAFFQEKVVDEEGYVLFVRENAVQVLMPRFGLETTMFLKEEGWKYDEEAGTQSFGDITLHQFDQLVVQVSVDSRNIQHQKVVIKIVEPKASLLFPSFDISLVTLYFGGPSGLRMCTNSHYDVIAYNRGGCEWIEQGSDNVGASNVIRLALLHQDLERGALAVRCPALVVGDGNARAFQRLFTSARNVSSDGASQSVRRCPLLQQYRFSIPGVSVEPAARSEGSAKGADDPPRKKSKVCVS